MRRTLKYIEAIKAAGLGLKVERPENEDLYRRLEAAGWWWDAEKTKWQKGRKPSTSMFKDDGGNPSGVLRVRLMGMAVDVSDFTHALTIKGWKLVDQSSEYPNRKGPGSRWYQTYKRD